MLDGILDMSPWNGERLNLKRKSPDTHAVRSAFDMDSSFMHHGGRNDNKKMLLEITLRSFYFLLRS